MKKILFFLLISVLLVGCSNTNDSSTAGDAGTSNGTSSTTELAEANTASSFPLTTDEALQLSQEVIENALNAYYSVPGYEGEEPSVDVIRERFEDIKNYVTAAFYTTHLADAVETCIASPEMCPYVMFPENPYFGLREKIEPINATHFKSSIVFPANFTDSFHPRRQTVDFYFEDGAWKIDNFSYDFEDLNLQEHEIESFLNKYALQPIHIQNMGTKEINGVEEQIYHFELDYADTPFELIARTGDYYSLHDGLEYEESETYESDMDFYYSMLFDDQSIYKADINLTAPEAQQLMQRLEALEEQWQWAPPYTESDRAWLEGLHETYANLYTDVFDYYVALFPTVDGVNQLEQFNRSFEYVRSAYFEAIDIPYFMLNEVSVNAIADDLEMMRNQIYKMMLFTEE